MSGSSWWVFHQDEPSLLLYRTQAILSSIFLLQFCYNISQKFNGNVTKKCLTDAGLYAILNMNEKTDRKVVHYGENAGF